ncbi:M24 family metallopeptidase [Eisenibacter elegans]|jgi:Xaa-Pro aminopeptidase|uniref:M24 family metallopeptidase n=1 Tax=Eisenibacter elegans TaxID=997 RepID=UPI00042196E4|nr:M24 family metallopeptidase [Eisenibacter elegans]
MHSNSALKSLVEAEQKAALLFTEIETRGLLSPGLSEKELNTAIYSLADEMFGIQKYWHKRIVRAGVNTLCPYDENPPNLTLQDDDLVFLDFGPIFDEWEADFGRTYVLGDDPYKYWISQAVEDMWYQLRDFVHQQEQLTGAALYAQALTMAKDYGLEFGGEIAGHIIGHFPHEKLPPELKNHYIHPDNHQDIFEPDSKGQTRHWILEIHLVDRQRQIGGFFEQLLLPHGFMA